MSMLGFHTISELKLLVRVLVFSILNVNENNTRVEEFKKLEETMHVHT